METLSPTGSDRGSQDKTANSFKANVSVRGIEEVIRDKKSTLLMKVSGFGSFNSPSH